MHVTIQIWICAPYTQARKLRGMNTFSGECYTVETFCLLSKKGSTLKERILSPWEQILPFLRCPFSIEDCKQEVTRVSPLNIHIYICNCFSRGLVYGKTIKELCIKRTIYEVRPVPRQIISRAMMRVWSFISLSTLFKSYRDNGRVVIQGCVQ